MAVGGTYADVLQFGYPMKKSAKAPRYPPTIKLEKAHKNRKQKNLLTKAVVVPAFILSGLEFGEHRMLFKIKY